MKKAVALFVVLLSFVFASGVAAKRDHKITICHVPPGNPANAHSISVDLNAWEQGHSPHTTPAHVLDYIGECDVLVATPTVVLDTPVPTYTFTPVEPRPTNTNAPTATITHVPADLFCNIPATVCDLCDELAQLRVEIAELRELLSD